MNNSVDLLLSNPNCNMTGLGCLLDSLNQGYNGYPAFVLFMMVYIIATGVIYFSLKDLNKALLSTSLPAFLIVLTGMSVEMFNEQLFTGILILLPTLIGLSIFNMRSS